MSLLDLSSRELLARFASAEPTPGGGSASALAGAVGAALVVMVASMPKTRTGMPQERARLDTARAWATEALERLGRLVDDDSAAYQSVVAAFGLPKATETEKAARKEAIAAGLRRATEVPLDSAEACLVVLRAAVEAAAHGNPNALSDARTAGALGLAGLLGALENVAINLKETDPGAEATRNKTAALMGEGRQLASTLGLPLG